MTDRPTNQPDGLFELHMIGKLSPDAKKPAPENPALAQLRQDQENGRREAGKFAMEALYTAVAFMRDGKMDPKHRLNALKQIMDRAWGTPKPLSEEEKKGADAHSILDVLAAVSTTALASERQLKEVAAIEEKGVSTDEEAIRFLDELNGKIERAGETFENE